jgi:hypothetical protein
MDLDLSGRDRASVVAQTALSIVLGLVLANLLFNAVANELHAGYPYSSFLSQPKDRFGDFFKLAFSYPGAPIHPAAGFWRISDLFAHHLAEVRRYEGTITNHFHEPPVPTLLALGVRWLMSWFDPVVLFLGLLAVVLAALFATVLRVSPPGRPGVAFATATVLSNAALLAVDRGHFFALICASLTIAATFRILRGKADAWAILMFAIAVNIRPNAGIIPLALFLGRQGISFRSAVLLGLTSMLVFASTMAVVHQFYPAYTFDRFLKGIAEYAMAYGGSVGFDNGSSLYGMMRAVLGYAGWMTIPPLCVAALVFAPAILESRAGRLRQSECLFLVLSAYVFGSHVFADYHLLAFIVPLILVAREEGAMDRSAWAIVLASSLVLAPKNFIFEVHGDIAWSWQVVANPLTLLVASATVLWAAARRNTLDKDRSSAEATAAV